MDNLTEFQNAISSLDQNNNVNPFVGLRSYESNEGHLFFGRDEQVKDILLKLYNCHFLSVVGRSGCGKSSLIKAGVIPKLKAGFLAGNRDYWLVASMRPSGDAINNFVDGLNEAFIAYSMAESECLFTKENIISMGSSEFVNVIRRKFEGNRLNLLILIDQFEELFTYKINSEQQKNENSYFVNLLISLAREFDLPVYTIITMRSDYVGHCNDFFDLPELMNQAQYLVPKLKWQQIKEVIEFPIKLSGQEINSGLLDKLTNDSDKELDQLPVLQHCMMRTYEEWLIDKSSNLIGFDHYNRTGELADAINKHANQVFDTLTDQQKQIAKCLFQTITEFNADFEGIRRPQKIGDIIAVFNVSLNSDKGEVMNTV